MDTLDRMHALLDASPLSNRKIAAAVGRSPSWIQQLRTRQIPNPGILSVDAVIRFLEQQQSIDEEDAA